MDLSLNLATSAQGLNYGDLLMRNGDLVLTNDADATGTNSVGQDVLIRLRTFLGEVFVDSSLGVPWYQQLLGSTSGEAVAATLQNVVLSTPGVLQLTAWSSSVDRARRVLNITFAAVTASGNVSYSNAVALQAQGGT